jgi:hypothetical protein
MSQPRVCSSDGRAVAATEHREQKNNRNRLPSDKISLVGRAECAPAMMHCELAINPASCNCADENIREEMRRARIFIKCEEDEAARINCCLLFMTRCNKFRAAATPTCSRDIADDLLFLDLFINILITCISLSWRASWCCVTGSESVTQLSDASRNLKKLARPKH